MPDQNTIRHFRNRLTETGTLPLLERALDNRLEAHGLGVRAGRIGYWSRGARHFSLDKGKREIDDELILEKYNARYD